MVTPFHEVLVDVKTSNDTTEDCIEASIEDVVLTGNNGK